MKPFPEDALLKTILLCLSIQISFHKSKYNIKKADIQQVKQYKSEIYNKAQSNQATALVNDVPKVKLYGLVGPQIFISLDTDFLNALDQQITDQTNRSKLLTFNY